LQNKLLEAMAMELPCISSVLANQALGAKENEEILIGNSAEEYANHIVRLMHNKSYAQTIAQNGHAFVKNHFSWENSTDLLKQLLIR
jgi:polysaccharide biosynthesis protein PslH